MLTNKEASDEEALYQAQCENIHIKAEPSCSSNLTNQSKSGYTPHSVHTTSDQVEVIIKTEPTEVLGHETGNVYTHQHDMTVDERNLLVDVLESKADVQIITKVLIMNQKEAEPIKIENTKMNTSSSSNSVSDVPQIQASSKSTAICNYKFKLVSLKQFLKRGPENYQESLYFHCCWCEFRTLSSFCFSNHLKSEHSSSLQPCHSCSIMFVSKKTLMDHNSRFHRKKMSFKCSKCDFRCKREVSLRAHRRKIHTSQKMHICTKCDYSSFRHQAMKQHYITHHQDENKLDCSAPFTCAACKKMFLYFSQYQNHLKRHTGERPYACKFCSFRSSYKKNVTLHELRKHIKPKISLSQRTSYNNISSNVLTLQKPFQCEKCCQYFVRQSSLSRHIKALSCPGARSSKIGSECPVTSNDSNSTPSDVHETKANKERRIPVKIGSDTKQSKDDNSHICQACNEQFKSSKVLKRHLLYCVFNSLSSS